MTIDSYRLFILDYIPLTYGHRLLLSTFPPIKNKENLGKQFYPPFSEVELISQKKLYKLIMKHDRFRELYLMQCENFLNNENFQSLDSDLRKLLINHFTAVYYILVYYIFPGYSIIKQILDKLNG
jgi:hypothetical protein